MRGTGQRCFPAEIQAQVRAGVLSWLILVVNLTYMERGMLSWEIASVRLASLWGVFLLIGERGYTPLWMVPFLGRTAWAL